jgi:hypothetical protein
VLRGVRRVCGDTSRYKLPVTLDILRAVFGTLDMRLTADIVFWAACLVAFFSFFRKSNLLVPSAGDFDPSRHLCRSDFTFNPEGAILTIRWSKTIQFKERVVLVVPIPRIPNSVFCRSQAAMLDFRFPISAGDHSSVPSFYDSIPGECTPLTRHSLHPT